jgi:hypothetical protein
MLQRRTFAASTVERDAVEQLIGEHASDGVASVTRTEPGETGPLRVEIGEKTWHVAEDGSVEQVT